MQTEKDLVAVSFFKENLHCLGDKLGGASFL